MKIQICLVSHQAAANLLPAFDPSLKPAKVVLVVTTKMQAQADRLKNVFKENGIAVDQLKLSDEQDFRRIEEELLELAEQLDGQEVALNITGGTKLMSVAAQSVAQVSNWRMFYIDADSDSVIWLDKDAPAPTPLQQQLRLPHYLRSYGFELSDKPKRSQATAEQQQLTQTLVQEIGSLENFISVLNGLAQEAENKNKLSVQMNEWQRDSRGLDALLRHFETAQALSVKVDQIIFPTKDARDYVKGGWLELHAIQTVHQVSGDLAIRDKAVGLEVIDQNSNAKNELDIAFMARNRLFVIECKTARIDKPQGNSDQAIAPKANDALFKLAENCRRIGGSGTRGMLVSYRKLREPELKLAAALGITVVDGKNVARLAEKIKSWVQT